MAYRFTNTEKWSDSWFSGLKQIEMLLFIYLCDNCDVAGFTEVNFKRWASDLNSTPDTIEGALKGLQRGIIISNDGECVYLKNFLRHQKNLPLNPNNRVCIGILKRFDLYKHKFDIQDISEFIESPLEGASMGHQCLTGNGIGKGNGIVEGIGGVGEKGEIEKRMLEFKTSIEPHLPKYGKDMCNDFYLYWTELNKSKTKMRFELQKTWEVGKRLATWAKNDKNFNNGQRKQQSVTSDEELAASIRAGIARGIKENSK